MLRDYDTSLNAVVLDLAPHPVDAWGCVYHGKLLPVRFSTEDQAHAHLSQMLVADEQNRRAA